MPSAGLVPSGSVCPLAIHTAAFVAGCGDGSGGGIGYSYRTSLNGGDYSSSTTTAGNYSTSGSSTNNSSGEVSGTGGTVSTDVTNGVNTITESVASISSQPVTLRYLDAAYIQPGANAMPSGGTLNMDATRGTATGDFIDAKGRSWHLVGSPDADGHTVDVQFSSSAGDSGTLQVDGNAVAPAQMATMPQSSMRAAMSAARHTSGRWGPVGAVGGVVAAGLGVVAGGLALTAAVITAPAWVPIAAAGVAMAAAVVGLGAATAAAVDYFEEKKAKSK